MPILISRFNRELGDERFVCWSRRAENSDAQKIQSQRRTRGYHTELQDQPHYCEHFFQYFHSSAIKETCIWYWNLDTDDNQKTLIWTKLRYHLSSRSWIKKGWMLSYCNIQEFSPAAICSHFTKLPIQCQVFICNLRIEIWLIQFLLLLLIGCWAAHGY